MYGDNTVCDMCKRHPRGCSDIDYIKRPSCEVYYGSERALLIEVGNKCYCVSCAGKILEELKCLIDQMS